MKKYITLRKAGNLLLICLFMVSLQVTTGRAYSQTIPSLFVVADFMKVQPENYAGYLKIEQEIWKPLHEERIQQGIIVGWYLYAVEFSGTADEYNYVVITLYDNATNLQNPWLPDIPARVHPGLTLEDIMKKTYSTRTHVKSELLFSVATAPEIPMEIPAAYMQVNYNQVELSNQKEYENIESEFWLPIHNEMIRTGRTTGWSLWYSLFPRGQDRPYQYMTLNAFSEFSYVFELDYSKSFNVVFPDKNFEEIRVKTRQIRRTVRTELWDLIDYAIR
ncbi:MAG TPA: hypothetical protein VI583_12030 [Cyclobacteriaceae bacterium]|nr:hypothetical protein [Cyclobacteriaceae bacterium]